MKGWEAKYFSMKTEHLIKELWWKYNPLAKVESD